MPRPDAAGIDHLSSAMAPPCLWQGDELAASTLFSGDSRDAAVRQVRTIASRLSGDGAAEAGLEVLADCIAVASVQHSALTALIADLIRRKDLDSARGVSHLLKGSTDRLARLAEAHGALLARGTRPLVVVSAAAPQGTSGR